MIVLFVIQGGLVLVGAPLLAGVTRRLKARLQYRRGPSIWQPYRDLRKWWAKDAVESDVASPITGAVPALVLATMVGAVVLVPIVAVDAPLGGIADLLVVVGLLGLARLLLVLLALDGGSAFGGMGGSREIAIAALVEPGLILALAVSAMAAGSTDLSRIAAHGLAAGPGLLTLPILLAAAAYLIVAVAETGHEPVDNPDTHLELTMIHEGMIIEASGRRLAMLMYAGHLKLVVVVAVFAAAFLPFGAATEFAPVSLVVGIGAAIMKMLAASVGLGLLDAGLAKLRILALPSFLGLAALLAVTAAAASLWLPA